MNVANTIVADALELDYAFANVVVKLFLESYRPYTFGSFGKPTLQQVREAIAKGQLIYSTSRGHTMTSAAIFKILKADSYHTDFSGRRCLIKQGSVYVNNLGVLPGHVGVTVPSIVARLSTDRPNAALWIEIHEEDKMLREQLEKRLGFRYVMTKIKASSDIKSLYLNSSSFEKLPAIKPLEIPAFALLVSNFLSSLELKSILLELHNYTSQRADAWAQHYSHYNKRRSWTAFALRGFRPDDPAFICKPSKMSRRWQAENSKLLRAICANTSAARYFGNTMAVVRRIPGQKERVRFLRLTASRGELSRHADVSRTTILDAGASVIRLHIPLVTHEDVLFESWGLRGEHQKMHFKTGGLYYLDNRKPHRVFNNSPVDRIHLVVDVHPSQELESLMKSKIRDDLRLLSEYQ
jgi:hypothetical protein